MTLHGLFSRRDPAYPYPLEKVEQGDELVCAFAKGREFLAIVRREPSDFHVEVIDEAGVRMEIPATIILSHRPRGDWQEGRAA